MRMLEETRTFGLAALLIVLSLGLPTISAAGVFWEENFENHLNAGGNGPWDTGGCQSQGVLAPAADGCNPGISADTAKSGSFSLKSHYSHDCGMTDGVGTC